jgi:hypothetical protein
MPGYKFQTSLSSGEILVGASPAIILAAPGWLTGVTVITGGTTDVLVIGYNNASAASGTKLFEHKVVGANNYGGRNWTFPLKFTLGMTISIAGADGSAIVEYIPNV